MNRLFYYSLFTAVVAGCAHCPQNTTSATQLDGFYEGREVVDTEERIALRNDGTFDYDFIPFGQGGESYSGRWRLSGKTLILTAKMENGEDEEFPLEVSSEKGLLTLVYTWASEKRQRATMLISNVFVRSKPPNYSASTH